MSDKELAMIQDEQRARAGGSEVPWKVSVVYADGFAFEYGVRSCATVLAMAGDMCSQPGVRQVEACTGPSHVYVWPARAA
jgi:hypothetical protein